MNDFSPQATAAAELADAKQAAVDEVGERDVNQAMPPGSEQDYGEGEAILDDVDALFAMFANDFRTLRNAPVEEDPALRGTHATNRLNRLVRLGADAAKALSRFRRLA